MDELKKIYNQELSKTSSIAEVYTLLTLIQGLTIRYAQQRWGYSQRTLAGWFKVSNQTISAWNKKYTERIESKEV